MRQKNSTMWDKMESIEETRFRMTKNTSINKLAKALEKNQVDPQLIRFLKRFNKKKNLFTSSSCAGRIMLLGADNEEHKMPKMFIGKWHRLVKFKEVFELLQKKTKFQEIWFKQEPFIFHIVCKNLETAKKVLQLKEKLGIKRGGIFTIEDGRYIIELTGTNNMSLPVKFGDKILLDKKQMQKIIKKANQKLTKNYAILKNIMIAFQKEL